MKKTNLTVSLTTPDDKNFFKTDGYINEKYNNIIYIENDELKTKVKYNYQDNILIRENEGLILEIPFNELNKTKAKLFIKELNKKVEIDIETTKLINNNNNYIEVEYILENNKYLYIINMEE